MRSSATRAVMVAMAVTIFGWSVFAYSLLLPSAGIDNVGTQIAAGELFKQEALTNLQPQIDVLQKRLWLPPRTRRSIALIELRLAELDLLDGKAIANNPQFERARHAIVKSLGSAPSDGFMWLALFWLLKTRDGFSPALVPLLRMSYLMAPHEGWIALRRSPVVVTLLPSLPKDVARQAVAEFRSLVETRPYIDAAAAILTGPGWPYHNLLIRSLTNVPDDARQEFDNDVFDLGFDVTIPGVETRGSRPWH